MSPIVPCPSDQSKATKDCSQGCFPVSNSTKSFWQIPGHNLSDLRSTAELPTHSDIVIVGGGYAGVSTAYHLVEEFGDTVGSITLLEARALCSGATGRNGGHLRPDLYGRIPTYIDRAGARAGAEIAEFEISNLRALKRFIEEEGIDCDLALTRSMDIWCNEEAAKKAKAVYDFMVAQRFEYMSDAIFYTGEQVEGICGVKGAVACASFTAATLWPYKFIMHLVQKLTDNNAVNFQSHTPVKSIVTRANGELSVETERGSIHAKKVIYANNAYVSGLLPEYKRNIIPCKGICCRIALPAGKVAPLLNNSYIHRTKDDTLSYLIPRADGSIVVGGASAKFHPFRDQWYNNVDDGTLIDAVKNYYDGYMQRTFHGWETSGAKIDKTWSGVMGYSYDSNPHIGRIPAKENQFIIAGFNGHGMPVIWLSAKELAKMVATQIPFEKTSMPRLFQTSQFRIDRAMSGREEDGDIIGTGNLPSTKP